MNPLPRWLVPTLGALLSIFVLLLVVDKVNSLSETFKNKNPKNTISVPAEGRVTATPDLATVTLGVVSQGATAQAVQDDSTKKINRIIEGVKNDGVAKEDIVTSQFNIFPRHEYKDGKDTIVGYEANQTITVKVKGIDKSQDRLGKVLVSAADNGSNQIYGVSMSFENPDDLRQEARKLAIAKAKEKAQELASVAGLSLGRVVSLSESGGGGFPGPMPYATEALGRAGDIAMDKTIAPSIEPGTQDIIENMTVTFEVR